MTLQIFDCEQGTPEWFACRAGIPTASEFHTVLAKGRGGGESKTRRTYLYKLVGERLTGQPTESYTNAHMERGKAMEDEARQLYAFLHDVQPQRIGFMRYGDCGASPDSLIGDDGGCEIKTHLPHIHLPILDADELPPDNKAQVQGCLMVSGREWWDFISYWPRLPIFIKRVYRDEPYIQALRCAIDEFNEELAAMEQRYRAMMS